MSLRLINDSTDDLILVERRDVVMLTTSDIERAATRRFLKEMAEMILDEYRVPAFGDVINMADWLLRRRNQLETPSPSAISANQSA